MSDVRRADELAVPLAEVGIGQLLGEGGEGRAHEARYLGDDAELSGSGPLAAKLLTDATAALRDRRTEPARHRAEGTGSGGADCGGEVQRAEESARRW